MYNSLVDIVRVWPHSAQHFVVEARHQVQPEANMGKHRSVNRMHHIYLFIYLSTAKNGKKLCILPGVVAVVAVAVSEHPSFLDVATNSVLEQDFWL